MSASNSNNRDTDNKRKRLTQACELCRRKKIRCDGSKPTCGNCARLKSECTYSSSSKKRGPRQGYIEMLEQRLAKMEKILLSPESEASKKPTAVEHEEDLDDEYEDDTDLPPSFNSASVSSSSISNKLDKFSVNSTQSHTTTTTTSNCNNNNKYSKRSSEDINHDCASPTSFSSISSNFPSPPAHALTHQSSRSDSDLLPSMEVIQHIVDIYFSILFNILPIFDENTFRNDVKEGRCSDFLLLSLLGACARFSDRPDIKENPAWHAGEKFAEKARPMILKAVDEPSISNLQAITLLTLHEYGCGRGPRSWMYGGMAIRMAMELGLHEDTDEDESGSSNHTFEKLTIQETRRRLFWTIFTVDKFSSAATGRPSSIQEHFCTAFLPAQLDSDNREQYYTETLDDSKYILLNINGLRESSLLGTHSFISNSPTLSVTSPVMGRRPHLNCFAYLIRATSLLGKVTSYVNLKGKDKTKQFLPCDPDSDFSKLDRSIEEWHDQLPMHLRNTPANFELYRDKGGSNNNPQFILIHVLHNTLRVLLHRPSLVLADTLNNDVVQPEIKEFVLGSVEKCMAAVDNVTFLLKEVGKHAERMPPFLTYLAYTVATVVVSTSFSPRVEEAQKAKQALGIYFQFLLNARNYWAMADKLYFMIRDLYAIHNNVLRRQHEQALTEQQENAMKQQRERQLQQYQQQQQQMQQQMQLQQFNQLELPVAGSSSSLGDWNLPFYTNALSEGPNSTLDSRNDYAAIQANIFQLPEGYDQPLMFPSALTQNRDINNM